MLESRKEAIGAEEIEPDPLPYPYTEEELIDIAGLWGNMKALVFNMRSRPETTITAKTLDTSPLRKRQFLYFNLGLNSLLNDHSFWSSNFNYDANNVSGYIEFTENEDDNESDVLYDFSALPYVEDENMAYDYDYYNHAEEVVKELDTIPIDDVGFEDANLAGYYPVMETHPHEFEENPLEEDEDEDGHIDEEIAPWEDFYGDWFEEFEDETHHIFSDQGYDPRESFKKVPSEENEFMAVSELQEYLKDKSRSQLEIFLEDLLFNDNVDKELTDAKVKLARSEKVARAFERNPL